MPLPKPTLLHAPSTPTTGAIIKSILFILNWLLRGSKIAYLLRFKGKRYFIILKLSSTIKGTNIVYFWRYRFISGVRSASIGMGR